MASCLIIAQVCFGFTFAPCFRRGKSVLSMQNGNPRTMFDKIWDLHLIDDTGGNNLIYIDRHLVHEVTSPQAFEGLKTNGRKVRRPDCTLVTVDHNVPTTDRSNFVSADSFIKETDSRTQVCMQTTAQIFDLLHTHSHARAYT